MTPKQRIVAILREKYNEAETNYRRAHAEHMGQIAAANAWDELNKDDGVGGFSSNPYNITNASNKDTAAELYLSQMREAYNFAVDTFVE